MGLMFARRRMEEANKRAALKAEGQREREKEVQEKLGEQTPSEPEAPAQPQAQVQATQGGGKKNGANSKGAK